MINTFKVKNEEKVTVIDVHRVTGAVEQATGISRSSQVFTACDDSTSVLLVFLIPETVTDIFHYLSADDLTILANAGITKIQLEDLEIANISKYITNPIKIPEKRVESVKPTLSTTSMREQISASFGVEKRFCA